ncbi:hypothetical protein E6P97_04010 [Patescibacteria group bacterium]|nr:MAG: hypothetical protein E6P97_04010 [Patescibacteria group bacterium]
MLRDYTTYLIKNQFRDLSDRKAQKLVRVIDQNIMRLFALEDRFEIGYLLPGMRKRRYGSRFGLTIQAQKGAKSLTWHEVVQRVRSDMHFKSDEQTIAALETYLKAHLSVMSATARLRFAQACPDDLLRVYLRVLNS